MASRAHYFSYKRFLFRILLIRVPLEKKKKKKAEGKERSIVYSRNRRI